LLSTRLFGLIRRAYEKTGKRVVVLIDEYDKPLINTMDDPESHDTIRKALKGFYGVLKSADPYLRFVMLTGVTKFSKVSVFSDLNQLIDISMIGKYAGICGISESELIDNFKPEIQSLADAVNLSYDATLAELKKRYDGYHFCKNSEGMYNPFSILNTFFNCDFAYYWFATGTPTFLINLLKRADFDVRKLSDDVTIAADSISDYRVENNDPVPILYQSGYLSIKDYNKMFNAYILGFPNEEVKYGFLRELLPAYMPGIKASQDFFIMKFIEELQAGETEAFMTRLRTFFASIPTELNNKTEKHYQTVFYLLFQVMGQFVQTEVSSATGRADAVVSLPDRIYVFEFKLSENETAEDALKQIDDKNYLIPYISGTRKVIKIGAEFSAEQRSLKRWIVG
jgi:hypothetical protein